MVLADEIESKGLKSGTDNLLKQVAEELVAKGEI